MTNQSHRRAFLRTAGTAFAGGLAISSLHSYELPSPLGFMLHGVRALAAKDLPGTLSQVKAAGYSDVELVSFKGFGGPGARDGFGPLAPLHASEVGRIVHDAGLTTRSCHFKFDEFSDEKMGQSIDWAHGTGVKYMTITDVQPSATLADWQRHFNEFNRWGQKVRAAGLQLGLHTQADGWKNLDGAVPFEALLKAVDPTNIQLQLDLSTTLSMNVDAAGFLRQHPGRVFGLHMRDSKRPERPGGYLYSVPLGQGDMDWRTVLPAAKEARVELYIVEMQVQAPGDPIAALRDSAVFLRDLKV